MNNRFNYKAGGIMIEYTIIIVFMIIISFFIVRFTAATEKIRSESEKTSKAVLLAESTMDSIYAGTLETGSEDYVRYYDGNWEETDSPDKFRLTLSETKEPHVRGDLVTYEIDISMEDANESDALIYTLKASKYLMEVAE